jgi:type III pantothenate kinase
MILCLDCGNSRLKWGLRKGSDWLASGVLAHTEITQLAQLLPAGCAPQLVIGCNVAAAARIEQIETALGLPIDWITAKDAQCGVVNGYEVPASLGADRWAALIGARALHRGAALVVLAGTATTIDVLDAGGRHQGGLILPGIDLMTSALAAGTAQLPLASGEYREFYLVPRNTHDAIVSGAIQATLGAIQRMYAVLPLGQEAVCLLAGGAADVLQARLDVPYRRIDHLVLEGLACIAVAQSSDPA